MPSLVSTLEISLTSKLTNTADLNVPTDQVTVGAANFDAIQERLTAGTGNQQGNLHWHDERTLAAGANDDLDLAGGLVLAGPAANQTLTFTRVKQVLVVIDAADGTKRLRVGPQGVANAFQGWEGGVAAGNYAEFYDHFTLGHRWAGWTVTAGTGDILRINNPSAVSVTYRIYLNGLS